MKHKSPRAAFYFGVLLGLLVVSGFGDSELFSQGFSFKHYSVDDGLAGSHINCIHQDSRGYLWLGMVNGLSRFDGVTFTDFSDTPNLPGIFITRILEDQTGRIWISCAKDGIVIYYQGTFQVIGDSRLTQLGSLAETRGYVWFTCHEGLFRYHGNSRTLTGISPRLGKKRQPLFIRRYREKVYLKAGNRYFRLEGDKMILVTVHPPIHGREFVHNFFIDRMGRFWSATGYALSCYDGKKWLHIPNPTQKIMGMYNFYQTPSGTYWFGLTGGVYRLVPAESEKITEPGGQPKLEPFLYNGNPIDTRVCALTGDREGTVWIATQFGLYMITENNAYRFTQENGLINRATTALLEDRERNLWIGTTSVLSVLKSPEILIFNQQSGLKDNLVWSIAEDPRGGIWFGSNQGVDYWDGNRLIPFRDNGVLKDRRVFTIMSGVDGVTWFGTDNGLFRFDGSVWQKVFAGRKFSWVKCFHREKNGVLWIGTRGGGLLKVSPKRSLEYQYNRTRNGSRVIDVQDLERDRRGQIFIAGDNGIWTIDDENFLKKLHLHPILDKDYIFNLLCDSQGHLWICGKKGLYRMECHEAGDGNSGDEAGNRHKQPFTVTHYSEEDGLSDRFCYFTAEDREGNLWIGTNKGLNVLNSKIAHSGLLSRESGIKPSGKRKSPVFKSLTAETGLASSEMNQGAILLDSRNYLWVGTIGGVSRIDLYRTGKRQLVPRLDVTGLRINNRDCLYGPRVFDSDMNNIQFSFTGLNFYAPDQVSYYVKLEPLDKTWKPAPLLRVLYPDLKPGRYVMNIRAENVFENTRSPLTAIPFTIKPPKIWRQAWVYALFTALFLLINGFIYIKNRKLMKVRKKIFRKISAQKDRQKNLEEVKNMTGSHKKYSTLTQEQADGHLERLLDLMNTRKIFTEPGLDLKSVAQRLDIAPRSLSELVNRELKQGFSNLLNQYRVEEAKKRLIQMDKRQKNILMIAFEVGFNSKTSFNTLFKKYAGLTPSQFFKKHNTFLRESEAGIERDMIKDPYDI